MEDIMVIDVHRIMHSKDVQCEVQPTICISSRCHVIGPGRVDSCDHLRPFKTRQAQTSICNIRIFELSEKIFQYFNIHIYLLSLLFSEFYRTGEVQLYSQRTYC